MIFTRIALALWLFPFFVMAADSLSSFCITCHYSGGTAAVLPNFTTNADLWSQAIQSQDVSTRNEALKWIRPMYRHLVDRESMPPSRTSWNEFHGHADAQALISFLKKHHTPEVVDQSPVKQIVSDEFLKIYRSLIPKVHSKELTEILSSPALFFYDDDVMPPAYVDDEDGFQGFLYTSDSIAAERTFVIAGSRFRFPFGTTFGLHTARARKFSFLYLPIQDGKRLKVALVNGGRRWVFPKGAYLGEVLFMPSASGSLTFEMRVSWKEDGVWKYDTFRPFPESQELLERLAARPVKDAYVTALEKHLGDPSTLVADSLSEAAREFGGIHPVLSGGKDLLPPLTIDVIQELLNTPFRSAVGTVWRSDPARKLLSYAATGPTLEHLAPYGYRAHFFPNQTATCNRCHFEAGRDLGSFFPGNPQAFQQLESYGRLWGSDQKFSFFPLSPGNNAVPRAIQADPRLVAAGIVEPYEPGKHPSSFYLDTTRHR